MYYQKYHHVLKRTVTVKCIKTILVCSHLGAWLNSMAHYAWPPDRDDWKSGLSGTLEELNQFISLTLPSQLTHSLSLFPFLSLYSFFTVSGFSLSLRFLHVVCLAGLLNFLQGGLGLTKKCKSGSCQAFLKNQYNITSATFY